MELVRGLRTNGLADLAMTYLDELKASNPPPEIKVILPLEYARTRLALAAQENDEAKRNNILNTARAEFDTFINSNPGHPQTPFANIDVARLNGLKGKTLYSKARWISNPEAKMKKMEEARVLFKKAADQYAKTLAAIEKQADKTPELESLEMAAKLDQAINYYDSSKTYGDSSDDGVKRGDDIEAAKKILEKIMLLEKDPAGWVARAWMSQIFTELEDGPSAKAQLDLVLKQRNNAKAQAGIRLAQYFKISQPPANLPKKGGQDVLTQNAIDEATAWLNTYRAYRNTPEGVGALFIRATKRFQLGLSGVTFDKTDKSKIVAITPGGLKHLEEAERDFKELMDTENEYAEQANTFRTQILVAVADQMERATGDIRPEALGSFEKCSLEAQVQAARLYQFTQKKPAPKEEQIQAEQKRRYKSAVQLLEYGLSHISPSDPVREVFNAQEMLVKFYYRLDLFPNAAILAEYVARTNPRHPRAAMIAGYAMECYRQSYLQAKNKAGGGGEEIDGDLERRREIARYIINTWPDSPSSDFPRYLLAGQYVQEGKFENAMQMYQAIRPTYPAYPGVCLEMGATLIKMVRPDETDPTLFYKKVNDKIVQHQAIWDKTIQAISSLPEPADDENVAANSTLYFNAQVNLAMLYQLHGKWDDAKNIGVKLLELNGKLKGLKEEPKELNGFRANTIIYKAIANDCAKLAKDKKYGDVNTKLEPLIEQMKKEFEKKAEGVAAPKDFRDSQRQIIVMALQISVQDSKIPRAIELLNVLEQSGGDAAGNFAMMRSLAGTIRGQLEALRADVKKNPKDKEKLAEIENLRKGFTEFLNQIAPKADQLKDENAKIEMKIFLAQGYAGVDAYADAAKLLKPVRDSLSAMKIAPKSDLDRKKKQVEYSLVHNYRLAKKDDEAEALFKEIIGPIDPKKPGPIPANLQGWGYTSPAVRKERALLKEEIALNWNKPTPSKAVKWKEAIDEWGEIKRLFANQIPNAVNEKSPSIIKPIHFMYFAGGVMGTTNPIVIELRDKIQKKIEEVNRKRTLCYDIIFDLLHCNLKAYHAIDPAKYEGAIDKIANRIAEFAVSVPDLTPEHHEKIKEMLDEYPKTFKPKYQEYLKEWKDKPKDTK
jgi:hypothetical protein